MTFPEGCMTVSELCKVSNPLKFLQSFLNPQIFMKSDKSSWLSMKLSDSKITINIEIAKL